MLELPWFWLNMRLVLECARCEQIFDSRRKRLFFHLRINSNVQAAFADDIAEVRRLIANKIDPTSADYDLRSGLVIYHSLTFFWFHFEFTLSISSTLHRQRVIILLLNCCWKVRRTCCFGTVYFFDSPLISFIGWGS
jgi:hypothetical protein